MDIDWVNWHAYNMYHLSVLLSFAVIRQLAMLPLPLEIISLYKGNHVASQAVLNDL